MAVVKAELITYAPLNNPADFTSTLGGGIDVTSPVSNNTVGELMIKAAANAGGGADRILYSKGHIKNTNATDDLSNAVVWIDNALLLPSADGTISIQSSSALDDTSYFVKLIYENAAGTQTSEFVSLNGTSAVTSTGSMKASTVLKAELRYMTGGSPAETDSLTNANGDITLTRGIALGKIPEGYSAASGKWELALEGSLDDTETTTDRTTAPGVVVFSLAQDEDSGIAVANSGTLTHGTSQGYWIKQTLPDGQLSSSDLVVSVRISGTDS